MKFYRYNVITGHITADMMVNVPITELGTEDSHSYIDWQEGTMASTHWVDGDQLKEKVEVNISSVDGVIPVEIESAVITNLPSDSWVRIRGTATMPFEEIIVPSGGNSLVFSPPTEGIYIAHLIGKYSSSEITFEAISVDTLKTRLSDSVNERKNSAMTTGLLWSDKRWDADSSSQAAITNVVVNINAGLQLPEDYFWTDFDGSNVPMTNSDMLALSAAMVNFTFAIHSNSTKLKALIESATTLDELISIDINSGWPE